MQNKAVEPTEHRVGEWAGTTGGAVNKQDGGQKQNEVSRRYKIRSARVRRDRYLCYKCEAPK